MYVCVQVCCLAHVGRQMYSCVCVCVRADAKQTEKARKVGELLEHLRVQVSIRKAKNTDILTLSQEVGHLKYMGYEP